MNLTSAVMLVNTSIRPVRVEYDPDVLKNNSPHKLFKTFDESLKKDDLVIVPTNTRQGFTIAKVIDVDFTVDFNSAEPWAWIAGKMDKKAYDRVLEEEKEVISKIGKSQEMKMRAELARDMGLGEIDFSGLDVVKSNSQLIAPATPRGYAPQPVPQPAQAYVDEEVQAPEDYYKDPAKKPRGRPDPDDEIPF